MDKRSKKNKLNSLFYLGLSLFKRIAKPAIKFGKFAVSQLLIEILLGSIILGFAYVLVLWGISSTLSFYIAASTVLAIFILLTATIFIFSSSFGHRRGKRVRIKLARWIIKTFIDRTSPEWTEYQDWLHDIFLARRQLIDSKCPRWKVALITYWRLSAFLVVVGLAKLKSIAASVMQLR